MLGITIWENTKQKLGTLVIQKYRNEFGKHFLLHFKKTKYLTHQTKKFLPVRPIGIANDVICRYKMQEIRIIGWEWNKSIWNTNSTILESSINRIFISQSVIL